MDLVGKWSFGGSSRRSSPEALSNELDHWCLWLSSIPPHQLNLLQQTQQYQDLLQAMTNLEHLHRHMTGLDPLLNFLQHGTDDDILLRILDYLDAYNLVTAMLVCRRWRDLCRVSARRKCHIRCTRQHTNDLQILRAQEQMEGIECHKRPVRVPILLLSRRIMLTNCGDAEFNGIYYCTASNGNGFVFAKPRVPAQRRTEQHTHWVYPEALPETMEHEQLLRCIIAKRFSNETILWYLSKEVIATETQGDVQAGDVTQVFCFWAKLMMIGDASPEICRYPSQTSILARHDHDEGWQTLSTTLDLEPPIVELMD